MKEKKMLGDFISQLRKEKGFSQTELGDMVGVSNKAVSKWETGEANPELNLVPKLAQVLGVTADELLACEKNPEKSGSSVSGEIESAFGLIKIRGGEYISKRKTKKGTPYVHINFADGKTAKGILAVGFKAKGIISAGFVSIGVISIGLVSIGILALGLVCLGIVALGGIAVGIGVAAGGIAVGIVAVGGISVGFLSVGGIAVGYYAHTGTEGLAYGKYLFYHD